MKIQVTATHIALGARCNAFGCALALAFRAAGFDVMISPDHVDFYDPETGQCVATLPLPRLAQTFQKNFDDRHLVQPFEFEMPGLDPGQLPVSHFHSVAVA